jgi:hypothetical protein
VITVPTVVRMIAVTHGGRVVAVRPVRAGADGVVGVVGVVMVLWRLDRAVRDAGCGTLTHIERRIAVALV